MIGQRCPVGDRSGYGVHRKRRNVGGGLGSGLCSDGDDRDRDSQGDRSAGDIGSPIRCGNHTPVVVGVVGGIGQPRQGERSGGLARESRVATSAQRLPLPLVGQRSARRNAGRNGEGCRLVVGRLSGRLGGDRNDRGRCRKGRGAAVYG